MRIFETIPPSLVLVSLVVAVGTVSVGLEFDLYLLVWLAVTAFGNWLDLYGVREN